MSVNSLDIHSQLIERCRKNERKAQHELYQLYSTPMYHVSLRIVNNTQEAEDILQEAFIDMFRKLDTFRGESTFGAWFKRIVANKSINAIKKKVRFTEDIDSLPDHQEEETEGEEPEYTVEHIKLAMSELSHGFRTVFALYMFEDYSHVQIAEELGISVGTSKSQLSRAKLKVRERLLNQKKEP
ncbi:MAG: RNA polymerase sigma factor [Flavobacteriales bacterium]